MTTASAVIKLSEIRLRSERWNSFERSQGMSSGRLSQHWILRRIARTQHRNYEAPLASAGGRQFPYRDKLAAVIGSSTFRSAPPPWVAISALLTMEH